MKIGYFQFLSKFLKVKENLNEIENLLKQNKKRVDSLNLIVFPEYFLSGPLKLDLIPKYEKEVSSQQIENSFRQISKQYPSVTFVMGSALLKRDGSYFNTSLILKDGIIIGEYHKKALIYNENYLCQSDNKKVVFTIGKTRIGIAICWDLILPEVFRSYVKEIDLVIIPSFWGIAGNALQAKYSFSLEKKYYDALGIARAYENAYALLFVNSVGKYKSSFYSDRMMGGSYFVLPPYGVIQRTTDKNPSTLHTIKLDLSPLSQYRKFYAIDKDYFYYKSKKVI